MTRFGYTLMTEQSGPKELVRYAAAAEQVGFDFEVSSDHFFPWLSAQGHAPYAWTVLGAVAQVTERVELMTYVTCPILRYHPAVVAQKAATLQILADGRFTLGLGAGENLNEHVVGQGWPSIDVRQDMLAEAIEVIRELHGGDLVTYDGEHFRVDSARIWDVPEQGVDIALAVSGEKSVARFAPLADHLIAVEPKDDLVTAWNKAEGAPQIGESARAIGQIPISWDPDVARRDRARARPVPLVRRRLGGQRRPPHHRWLRGRHPVRPPGGRRRRHPLRPRPRRDRRGGQAVLGGRFHRRRDRPDRRRDAAAVPRRGRRAAAGEAAGGRRLTPATLRMDRTARSGGETAPGRQFGPSHVSPGHAGRAGCGEGCPCPQEPGPSPHAG